MYYKNCYFITGGIGSGKSSVCRALRDAGETVYDLDELWRKISFENLSETKRKLGFDFKDSNHLASEIFEGENDELRAQLHKVTNEYMIPVVNNLIATESNRFFIEASTFFESGMDAHFNDYKKIFVDARVETRIERIRSRNKDYNEDRIQGILRAQGNTATKKWCSDFVVDNNNDLDIGPLRKWLCEDCVRFP